MLRVSVTTLESYRRYRDGVSEMDTEERLVEKLKGLFTGNPKTRIGSAFHSIIEIGRKAIHLESSPEVKEPTNIVLVGEDKIRMTMQQTDIFLKYRRAHPVMIHEIPLFKVYDTPRLGQIMITAKTDGIEGRIIRDAKVKFRKPDYVEYLDSFQWRFYQDIMGLDTFYYDIFEVIGFNQEERPADISSCIIEEHEPLRCDRYIKLAADCQNLVTDFLEYIHLRDFFTHLKQATIYHEDSFF